MRITSITVFICLFTAAGDKNPMNNEKEVELTNTLNTAQERAVALRVNEITISEETDLEAVSSIEDTVLDGFTH